MLTDILFWVVVALCAVMVSYRIGIALLAWVLHLMRGDV